MKNYIIKSIACLLSFCIAFGIALPMASALSIPFPRIIVIGSLDKRMIQKVVRLHENEIRHCYETALQKDKTLQGMVKTKFTILDNGAVEKAWIEESTLNNPDVEQCIVDKINNWEFYGINTYGDKVKTIVEYPYTFVSNYKQPTILEHVRLIMNEDDMRMEYYEAPTSPDEVMEILLNNGGNDET